MFEEQTFTRIIQRMLQRIPNSVDKREGSIIYDAMAPAAKELVYCYKALDMVIREAFPATSSFESLVKHAASYGLEPLEATNAIVQATLTMEPETRLVPVGTLFQKGELVYEVIESLGESHYLLKCHTAGEIGNDYFGLIVPIYNIDGLKRAELTGLAIPGTDSETAPHLLRRLMDTFGQEAFGGNMAQYKQMVNGLQGVGGCKIIRHFEDEDFHVGIIVIDSTWHTPSPEMISQLQETIHPLLPDYEQPTIENSGDGLTPIFHVAIVKGVRERKINVKLHLTFDGSTYEQLEANIKEALAHYLETECAMKWADSAETVVRISGLEQSVLDVDGVIDIRDTEINSSLTNLKMDFDEIPVLGEVTNE